MYIPYFLYYGSLDFGLEFLAKKHVNSIIKNTFEDILH